MPTTRRIVRRAEAPAAPARSPSKTRKVTAATSTAAKPAKIRRTPLKGAPPANGQAKKRSFKGGTLDSAPSAAGTGLWGLKKGTTKLRFLSEPEASDDCPTDAAFHWFQQYYDESARHFFILADGEDAPDGARVTTRYVAAAYDRTDNDKDDRVKYFSIPTSLGKTILKQFKRFHTVCDSDVYIDNEGANINTEYSITFDRAGGKIRNIAAVRESIDIPSALEAEKERLDKMPDRPPEKKGIKELRSMPLDEFRAYAKSLDIPTKGKKRGEVIDEILETQD